VHPFYFGLLLAVRIDADNASMVLHNPSGGQRIEENHTHFVRLWKPSRIRRYDAMSGRATNEYDSLGISVRQSN
jgi:hypothetical protein